MFTKSIFALLALWGSLAWSSVHSAYRDPAVPYTAYKARAALLSQGSNPASFATPVDEAEKFSKAHLPTATAWPDEQSMNERFRQFRDYRFLKTSRPADFMRRSSWLYPDDGCFARAALAILNLGSWSYPVPKKVFVFGDLKVKTKNSPDGEVTWWYHVAPLVEVAGEKYVLDPAIHPDGPMTLAAWIATMSGQPDDLEVAVCGSGAYTPYDACFKETDGRESGALAEQRQYLDAEWERLEELGRNPVEELGDLPPWLDKPIP